MKASKRAYTLVTLIALITYEIYTTSTHHRTYIITDAHCWTIKWRALTSGGSLTQLINYWKFYRTHCACANSPSVFAWNILRWRVLLTAGNSQHHLFVFRTTRSYQKPSGAGERPVQSPKVNHNEFRPRDAEPRETQLDPLAITCGSELIQQ